MLIVDDELRIRRYTPQSGAVVSILPTDVGRPVTDLRLKVGVADLASSIRDVIRQGQPSETDVQDERGCWHSMRIRPFRTVAGALDGAVIAIPT